MKTPKRNVDIVIISDVHLGTYGCHAKELYKYLKSINPKKLILNGDIIDIWQFKKRYWPKSHMKVVKHLTELIANGVEVTYITGNHDEMLRRFTGFEMGSFSIVNKVTIELKSGKAWIFHGDVFDVTMQHSKWLAKLGGAGYDMLILLNRFVNNLLERIGKNRISISKRIKNSVKGAVAFINQFENLVIDLARENGYRFVVCGHIHQPIIKDHQNEKGKVTYLNSGDWVENLTSLEYNNSEWRLYRYSDADYILDDLENSKDESLNTSVLFEQMVAEFKLLGT